MTEAENEEEKKETTYIEAATAGTDALAKIYGLGNMRLALVLYDLCALLRDKGSRQLAIDLSGCTGMDSTFMGTLVNISSGYADADGWMCLVNVSAENRELLDMLGVSKLVQTRESFPIKPLKVARLSLPPTDDAARRLRLIKKAHERLVEIDERNQEKFGSFLKMLNASLNETPDGGRADEGTGRGDAEGGGAGSQEPQT